MTFELPWLETWFQAILHTMRPFELANPGPLRDDLVRRVLAGDKRATSCLLEDWLKENDPAPRVGERQILVNSDGVAVATVEITAIEQYSLGQVPIEVVHDEGEDFTDADEWRRHHERFWLGDRYDPARSDWQLPDNAIVVVERFRLM